MTTSTALTSSPTSSQTVVERIAAELFAYIGQLPDTGELLPEFLEEETYSATQNEGTFDFYAGAIPKADLPDRYFGAQLNQLWSHVLLTDAFVSRMKIVLLSAATIGALYDEFLNSNPSNPYAFQPQIGDLTFTIIGQENELIVNITYLDMEINIGVLSVSGAITHYVDIYVSENNRLVIRSTPTSLTVVGKMTVEMFGYSGFTAYLLEIERAGDAVNGHSYERLGLDEAALRSHIVFRSSDGVFTVAGEKGDFLIGSDPKLNVESYDSETGRYLGSKVLETLPTVTYETLWYPLGNLTGWTSVQFETDNDDEKDFPQVYFNGSATEFEVEYFTPLGLKTSRKYDIELKKTYTFLPDGEGGFTKQQHTLPFFFIQSKEIATNPFGTCLTNNSNISFAHTITAGQIAAIGTRYQELKDLQLAYKEVDVDAVITAFLANLPH